MHNGHALKTYRESQNITQAQLAKVFGVTRETVARWESGERLPSPARIRGICKKTGIPLSALRPDLYEIVRGLE